MIPAPRIEYPADGSVLPVRRYVWAPAPAAPLDSERPAPLRGKRVAIVGGADTTTARIAAALEHAGAVAVRITTPQPAPIDGIIDLNLDRPFSLASKDAWREPLRASVALLQSVYDAWCRETDASKIFYVPVTSMDQPLGGIWAGLAKTLPREIPNINVKVLDVDPGDRADLDCILVRELSSWGPFEIGYANGERFRLAAEREDASEPAIDLTPSEVVLISGGGRGIGAALALGLARNFGCRVVVTGRSEAPTGAEPWLALDDEAFKSFRQDSLRRAGPGRLAEARREIERISRTRELHRYLRTIDAERLPIEYRVCDFTRLEDVRGLIDSLGPRLAGIVHNAGVDAPKRLGTKPIDEFLSIVDVKVAGFLNILEALDNRPLKFLSSVGSLTGRMGGMVGQLDYAAANDGLAHLGMWAARNTTYKVKTLCWPTWEQVGMIANYGATLRYMSALNVEEGLYHWQRELLSGGSGEVTFIGRFGSALTPAQLHGYPLIPDLPDTGRLFSRWFYLGEPLEFRPFASMRSRNRIPLRYAPCITARNGRAVLPPGVLLEFAASLGDWIAPEGRADLRLTQIRDIRIDLASLDSCFEFEKHGQGAWFEAGSRNGDRVFGGAGDSPARGRAPLAAPPTLGATLGRRIACPTADTSVNLRNSVLTGAWVVDVEIVRPQDRYSIAQLRLVYTREEPPIATAPAAALRRVRSCSASDLWSTPFLPETVLPPGGIDHLLRLARQPGESELSIHSIDVLAPGQVCGFVQGPLPDGRWNLLDPQGRVILSAAFGEALSRPPTPLNQRMPLCL